MYCTTCSLSLQRAYPERNASSVQLKAEASLGINYADGVGPAPLSTVP